MPPPELVGAAEATVSLTPCVIVGGIGDDIRGVVAAIEAAEDTGADDEIGDAGATGGFDDEPPGDVETAVTDPSASLADIDVGVEIPMLASLARAD